MPAWRDAGVTQLMPLCKCTKLYQNTNFSTQSRAPSMLSKRPPSGYAGQYFNVLNNASENGLSSDTLGRLKDGTMPSQCSVESIVAPFIDPPLSECSLI